MADVQNTSTWWVSWWHRPEYPRPSTKRMPFPWWRRELTEDGSLRIVGAVRAESRDDALHAIAQAIGVEAHRIEWRCVCEYPEWWDPFDPSNALERYPWMVWPWDA